MKLSARLKFFTTNSSFDLPIIRSDQSAQTITLKAKYQGCADRGVCYPPMSKKIDLALPIAQQLTAEQPAAQELSEQDQIVQSLHKDSFGITLLSFFGFGLLLSLTPCIFPMIPILSGIIVGHGNRITTGRAFLLSLSYVVASALTYTVFGILAALFGSNLQTAFQQPWIIGLFSAIFVALSLSMFGFYHLELPKSLQVKLHNSSEIHRDGSLLGAAIMGALSSLIVGPCVAAPLAGALIYIGQTGDAVLGGSALFALGLGHGRTVAVAGRVRRKIAAQSRKLAEFHQSRIRRDHAGGRSLDAQPHFAGQRDHDAVGDAADISGYLPQRRRSATRKQLRLAETLERLRLDDAGLRPVIVDRL